MEKKWIAKAEVCLRLSAILLLVLTACLVAFDSQQKVIFYVDIKVTYKDLKALVVLVCVDSVAAAYNLVQLVRCSSSFKVKSKSFYIYLAWATYLLDQIAVYMVFATTCAALEHSVLVLTGSKSFQWLKWCNRFTTFCFQTGGALACNYVATAAMALISLISAFNLFRLYSPKNFLLLKKIYTGEQTVKDQDKVNEGEAED
ncbi:CASP-like protein 2C1 [Rutidosis leptorrhynchoides]|uniref:CASP-like protein 2C1 n=1 Tax=Rutidosis leptorrhynchoides TaxID=125765 RepID=UPI003A991D69